MACCSKCAVWQPENIIYYKCIEMCDHFFAVKMLEGFKLEMMIWCNKFKQWRKLQQKNEHLVEDNHGLPEKIPNILVAPGAYGIQLMRKYANKTSIIFDFDLSSGRWSRLMKIGVNHQACFLANHVLDSNEACRNISWLVGNNFWVIRIIEDSFKLLVDKYDCNAKRWVRFDLEHNFQPFCIDKVLTSNNRLILVTETRMSTTQILELDMVHTKKVTWKMLADIRIDLNMCSRFVILDKTLYGISYRPETLMIAVCLETHRFKTTAFPTNYDYIVEGVVSIRAAYAYIEDRRNLCELNGTLYLISIRSTGARAVHIYDTVKEKFDKIKEDRIKVFGHFTHCVWTTNNRIYQALNKTVGEPLCIDYFEVSTHEWFNLLVVDDIPFHIISVTGNDDAVYLGYYVEKCTVFRKIDLKPKLETIAMGPLADTIIYDKLDPRELVLPVELKSRLENMIDWKNDDIEALRSYHRINKHLK